MSEYQLNSNEGIVLKEDGIAFGKSTGYNDELILTNINLIWTKIGMFGFPKNSTIYPLGQIKVINGKVQALENDDGYSSKLDIYLTTGESLEFKFSGQHKDEKKHVRKWIKEISLQITGETIEFDETEESRLNSIPGAAIIAETLKGTFDTFKHTFQSKDAAKSNAKQIVSSNCVSCGAPISGEQGQQVKCSYCDTAQIIK